MTEVDERGPEPHRHARVTRWTGAGAATADDVVAAEEPLQVVLDGRPFAVIMRTPGHDLELVLGLRPEHPLMRIIQRVLIFCTALMPGLFGYQMFLTAQKER